MVARSPFIFMFHIIPPSGTDGNTAGLIGLPNTCCVFKYAPVMRDRSRACSRPAISAAAVYFAHSRPTCARAITHIADCDFKVTTVNAKYIAGVGENIAKHVYSALEQADSTVK